MTTTQIEVPTAKLNTGAEIPLLGFGTYQIDQSAIEFALKVRLPRSPARIIIVCVLTISFDFLRTVTSISTRVRHACAYTSLFEFYV